MKRSSTKRPTMMTNYVTDNQKIELQKALDDNFRLLRMFVNKDITVEEANTKYIEYVESIAKLTNYKSGFFGVGFRALLTYMYDTVKYVKQQN